MMMSFARSGHGFLRGLLLRSDLFVLSSTLSAGASMPLDAVCVLPTSLLSGALSPAKTSVKSYLNAPEKLPLPTSVVIASAYASHKPCGYSASPDVGKLMTLPLTTTGSNESCWTPVRVHTSAAEQRLPRASSRLAMLVMNLVCFLLEPPNMQLWKSTTNTPGSRMSPSYFSSFHIHDLAGFSTEKPRPCSYASRHSTAAPSAMVFAFRTVLATSPDRFGNPRG